LSPHADLLRDRISTSAQAKQRLAQDDEALELLAGVADALIRALRNGNTVFWCGNGGSSTDAEHMSAELLGRFYYDRPSLPSYCLASNTAAMTAIGNDYSYELTFARQLAGLAKPGDVLIGLSTSGNSANVVRAIEQAQEMGVTTVAFTGAGGGKMAGLADHVFLAPSDDTPRVQECHMVVGHTLCEIVEAELFPRP
jgi:D-sedoheptulose 7-phosphate isomerase